MASSIPCGPCSYNSINKNAEKWCTDCNEGFCNICEKAHKSMKVSRDHNFIFIEDYREIENMNVVSECQDHGSKLEMYCKIHEMALCITCFPAKHKGCSDAIIPLAEAARNAKTSTAFADLEHAINDTLENIEICVKDREAAAERIEKQEMAIKKIISNTRENIKKHLDDLERKLLNELSTTYSSCKSKYGNLKIQLNKIEKEIQRLKEQTSQLKRFAPDLQVFLSTHQMTKEVNDNIKVIKETIRSVKNYNIDIEIHKGLTSLLKDIDCFAQIKMDETIISCPFKDAKIDQAQIQVQPRRSVHDRRLQLRKKFTIKQTGRDMYISGCTILATGNLLIADNYGQKVLLEYNEDGHFIRDIPISGRPWDLTVIDTDHIVVSYSSPYYIEVIDIKKMTLERKTVKFKNKCFGISYSDWKIYAVVKNEGIVAVDMEGNILNTIKCNTDVYNITTIKNRIYYTSKGCVSCFSATGEEIWNFNDKTIITPMGIAVDRDQNVFVVGVGSNNLLMISDDGKVSQTLLTQADGLDKPVRVSYNNDKNLLLVCNVQNGSAFLFNVV